ncbi:SH3 domain-containing protein [Mastigocladopsis repens]|uniref:SH3 domain-containing protein n=1 Tax=Mastigocladopsis repens TaxID=221287 RepID=UPI000303F0DE|nr:SH3 domain-containing protein [Mastigocladopsis repens]
MAYLLKVTYSDGTNFKQSLKQANELGLCEKYNLSSGKSFRVRDRAEADTDHYRVTLFEKLGNPGCPQFDTWYVFKTHVDIQPETSGAVVEAVVINASTGLNVRESPDTSARVLGSIPNGSRISVYGEGRDNDGLRWIQVKSNQWVSSDGWVATDYLKILSVR